MAQPEIRPMLPADVDPATEMILSNDWGARREFLAFATSQPACAPMVAEANGVIVGTGIGTLSGPVGWIGTIFVEPSWRGQGLGRAITQEIIDRLESGGAGTLVLVATADGRRLYERMGFEVQTRYRIFEAQGLPALSASAAGDVREFRGDDLGSVIALDREGTGEDRAHIIERFATPETAKVLPRPGGAIDGFVIRAPWGGGATVARSSDAAARIIAARRIKAGPAGRVSVGLLQDNAEGIERLEAAGFRARWAAPRMVRGAALDWQPEWIWGQSNHAIG